MWPSCFVTTSDGPAASTLRLSTNTFSIISWSVSLELLIDQKETEVAASN